MVINSPHWTLSDLQVGVDEESHKTLSDLEFPRLDPVGMISSQLQICLER